MLVVAGQIRLDPERREAAIAAARAVSEATRREAGCISYGFSADLADPGLFYDIEEWESQAALDAHFKTPHMAEFQRALGGLGIRGAKIQRYEVASVKPLMG